jgi:hypothetical protein
MLELIGQPGDQQVVLGREVPVQRPERHVGVLGDGPHLHGVVAALGSERQRRVQDPLAPQLLGGRADVGLTSRRRLVPGTCSCCWHLSYPSSNRPHDQRINAVVEVLR